MSEHGGRYALRAQTDSSCAGEIISTVFESNDTADMRRAQFVMNELQEACIEADAEPGYNAGFHVHVGWPEEPFSDRDNMTSTLGRLVWQFCEWEATLMEIAAGRFNSIRGTMNATVRQVMLPHLNAHWGTRRHSVLGIRRALTSDPERATPNASNYNFTYTRHSGNDRHSNLNVRTRYDTFEFRLWNSTRSAWRMELWCLLSIAFMDLGFYEAAALRTLTDDPSITLLIELLQSTGHTRASNSLARQYNYMTTRTIGDVEPAFTVV